MRRKSIPLREQHEERNQNLRSNQTKAIFGNRKIPSISNILPESFIYDFQSLACNTVKHMEAQVIVIPQDRIIRGVFNVKYVLKLLIFCVTRYNSHFGMHVPWSYTLLDDVKVDHHMALTLVI